MRSNIYKYYLFQFFYSLQFFSPIIILFWQANSLTFTQIMLLQSIYAGSGIIFEVPTGVFADNFGKKYSLILGSFFLFFGFLIYGISHFFWQFAIGEVIVGIGVSFISGADKAFIHETLKSIGEEHNYKKIEGRANAVKQITLGLSSILGGLLTAISLGFPLILTGIASLGSLISGIFFTKPKVYLPREENTNYFRLMKDSLKTIQSNKTIIWFILYFALFHPIIWATNFLAQPYLKHLNIPIIYFGIIFAGFNLLYAFVTFFSHKIDKLTGNKPFLFLIILTSFLTFVLGRFANIYFIPIWAFIFSLALLIDILVSDRILKLIPHNKSATILSFKNLSRRFLYIFLAPIIGLLADKYSIFIALQLNALILVLVLVVLWYTKEKFSIKLDY